MRGLVTASSPLVDVVYVLYCYFWHYIIWTLPVIAYHFQELGLASFSYPYDFLSITLRLRN